MTYPRVGIGVFIKKDGKILLMKRTGSHGANTWCPPGGHLELYESIESCAAREALEETGLIIKNIKILGLTNDIMRDENKHYITIHVSAEIADGTPKIMEPQKATDIGWFPINNLPSPLFIPIRNFLLNKIRP